MTTRPRGLGRGLGALIAPTAPQRADAEGGPATITLPPAPAIPPDQVPVPRDITVAAEETATQPDDGVTEGTVVGQLCMLPVGRIAPNSRQPRHDFDEQALEELAASIREVGVLQPVVVRAIGT